MTTPVLIFTLLLAADRGAAGSPAAPSRDCGETATQAEMNNCFANEAKQTQQVLDALLKELSANLNPEQRKALALVQANWVEFRRAHCDWQAAFFDGGSIQPTIRSTCITALTRQRIDELKIDLCEGWGMTGECEASRRYDVGKPASGH